MRYILFSSFSNGMEAILLGYTKGVSKGVFPIREKTGLDSKTGQTPLSAFFFFTIYKKPPNSYHPPPNHHNWGNGVYRSLALATAVIHHRLRFYISGISIYEVGKIPIPIYTYNILPLRLSVVYMCVSYSFYISIVYTPYLYTTTILYTLIISYISFSFVFTLPFVLQFLSDKCGGDVLQICTHQWE